MLLFDWVIAKLIYVDVIKSHFSGFLRKVFGILSFQFLATFVFCFVLYLTPGVRGFVQQQYVYNS